MGLLEKLAAGVGLVARGIGAAFKGALKVAGAGLMALLLLFFMPKGNRNGGGPGGDPRPNQANIGGQSFFNPNQNLPTPGAESEGRPSVETPPTIVDVNQDPLEIDRTAPRPSAANPLTDPGTTTKKLLEELTPAQIEALKEIVESSSH